MLDLKNSEYFNSLSNFIKESIMQSGIDFNSEDDLREFVKNMDTI